MKQETKQELKNIGLMSLFIVIVFQLVFFREDVLTTLRLSAGLLYTIVVPGFLVGLHLPFKKLERSVLGICLMVGIVGIALIYFGYAGIKVYYSIWIIPAVVIVISSGWYGRKNGF